MQDEQSFRRRLGFDLERASHQATHAQLLALDEVQGAMPPRVDLRLNCSPVTDQGDLGACTAFAVGQGAREYLQRERGEQSIPLSPLFLYYAIRKLRNSVTRDSGGTITDAMAAIAGAGICPEAVWPYNYSTFTQKPPLAAYEAAGAWRLTTGVQLAGFEDMRQALARRQPVAFGMRIYKPFRDIGPDGELPLPQDSDVVVGGHAVTAVGYDDQRRVFIVRNSFGASWGDQGYFYMPYAYASKENVLDIWMVR